MLCQHPNRAPPPFPIVPRTPELSPAMLLQPDPSPVSGLPAALRCDHPPPIRHSTTPRPRQPGRPLLPPPAWPDYVRLHDVSQSQIAPIRLALRGTSSTHTSDSIPQRGQRSRTSDLLGPGAASSC